MLLLTRVVRSVVPKLLLLCLRITLLPLPLKLLPQHPQQIKLAAITRRAVWVVGQMLLLVALMPPQGGQMLPLVVLTQVQEGNHKGLVMTADKVTATDTPVAGLPMPTILPTMRFGWHI